MSPTDRNVSKTNKFADSGGLERALHDFPNHSENPQSISEITRTFGAIYAHRPFKDYQHVAVSAGEAYDSCGVTILSAHLGRDEYRQASLAQAVAGCAFDLQTSERRQSQ